MDTETDLLIVGAGPFGLALSAYASHLGIEQIVVGERMSFWRSHMPAGMYLRSDSDWHLDALNEATIDAYTASLGLARREVEPLSLDFYLSYVRWFQVQKDIECRATLVERLDRSEALFVVSLKDGSRISARRVVLALGFAYFAHLPEDTAKLLPRGAYGHTCDVVDLAALSRKRVLIVGGRQSAFEWAALLREHEASEIHLSYRHETPAFAAADWSWVLPLVESTVDDPGWFRRLSDAGKAELNRRLWAEGRLKLEPWLATRIDDERVHLWPGTRVAGCVANEEGLEIVLEPGARLRVDHVIFATGYKVDLRHVPMLEALLPEIACEGGAPLLNEHFESSVPEFYFTSMAATRDFGPFFAFTVSARASARVIGDEVKRSLLR